MINLTLRQERLSDQSSRSPQDPKERLGCQVQTGFTDIKAHTFFRSIDWEQVRAERVTRVISAFVNISTK